MQIKITLKGGKDTVDKLNRVRDVLRDLRSEFQSSGKFMKDYYTKVPWTLDGTNFGERWQELNPKYAERKRKKYGSKPKLEASGDMRRGFRYQTTKTTLRVSNEVAYFVYHQSTRPRRKIPRRQMLGLDDDLMRKVALIFADGIRVKIKRAIL